MLVLGHILSENRRREQMDVDIADPPAHQGVFVDEQQRLRVRGDGSPRQLGHELKNFMPMRE